MNRYIFSIVFSLTSTAVLAHDEATSTNAAPMAIVDSSVPDVQSKWEKLDPYTNETFKLDEFFAAKEIDETSHIIDRFGDRVYKIRDRVTGENDFPPELKCSKYDLRTFHGCVEARFFSPSTRVYFDTGRDSEGEIDIFNDGNLNVTLDFINLYFPFRLGRGTYYDKWSWGPILGAGIGAPASSSDSKDGESSASGAPVVLFSVGGLVEYQISDKGSSFAFEAGYSQGYTADESFIDNDDGALYVGLKITIQTDKVAKAK